MRFNNLPKVTGLGLPRKEKKSHILLVASAIPGPSPCSSESAHCLLNTIFALTSRFFHHLPALESLYLTISVSPNADE